MTNIKPKVIQLPEPKQGRIVVKRRKVAHAADPIKDARTMRALRAALADSGRYSLRNLAIFDLGVCSGRRCGDILCLQLFEVWDDLHGVKRKIEYMDQKTRKWKRFYLNDAAHANLSRYLEQSSFIRDGSRCVRLEAYLFPSRKQMPKQVPGSYTVTDRKGETHRYARTSLPQGCLEVGTYRRILQNAARKHGITDIEHLGTHSMRKTFGYHAFRQNSAEFVMLALGHSGMEVTRHYLTLDDEYLEEAYGKLSIPGMEENDEC